MSEDIPTAGGPAPLPEEPAPLPEGPAPLPEGIVSFLFTDIEGSTRLLQRLGDRYRAVLERHAELMRQAIGGTGGRVVSTEGDSFFAVFTTPGAALEAAAASQRALQQEAWPEGVEVKVRMGIHTGSGTLGGDNYVGLDVHRAARIAAAAHGGQVVVSDATASLVADTPLQSSLRRLGVYRLKDLEEVEVIHQLVVSGLEERFPPLRTQGGSPNNLPVELTSFVGRKDVADLVEMIRQARLVTLTGPGGTGKTRLSIQAGRRLLDVFPDGVWFVALAPITDPALVTATVLSTIGLPASADDPDRRLGEYLARKEVLLILDNFEQVVAAGPRVTAWMQQSPGLKVVVSSRIPLRVSGEQEFPVSPLELPDTQELLTPETATRFEAVALFADRAAAVDPSFTLTTENLSEVAEIVSRLDGLPLAIELAAARTKLLSPAEIRERLGLSLLGGGARDLPERQRSLRGAIEWSFELLDEDHRTMFARLGVFGGSFGLREAEAVLGPALGIEVFDGLADLVDHSLVRAVGTSERRFFMLETIRQFAAEKLAAGGDADETRRRHAEVYLELAEAAAKHLTRVGQKRWLDRLAQEQDNMRVAIGWAVEAGEADVALGLCFALWRFWQMRGYLQEGRGLVERALAVPGASLERRRDGLEAAGGMAYWQADRLATLDYYQEEIEVARQAGDRGRLADSLYNFTLPRVAFQGVTETPELEEALAIAREMGDRERLGTYTWAAGAAALLPISAVDLDAEAVRSVLEAALDRFEEAAHYLEGSDAVFLVGWNERMWGMTLLELGRLDEAEYHVRKGLEIFAAAGDVSAFALHVRDLAQLASVRGDPHAALLLAGATTALEVFSETRLLEIAVNQVRNLDQMVAAVGEERAEKLLAEGRGMSIEQILEMVRGG
jgi:predicted ATPase/class 3 adenylate cyclase